VAAADHDDVKMLRVIHGRVPEVMGKRRRLYGSRLGVQGVVEILISCFLVKGLNK
jgi:hypothetical protein